MYIRNELSNTIDEKNRALLGELQENIGQIMEKVENIDSRNNESIAELRHSMEQQIGNVNNLPKNEHWPIINPLKFYKGKHPVHQSFKNSIDFFWGGGKLNITELLGNINGNFVNNIQNLTGQLESESNFNESTKEQINVLFARIDDIYEKLYEFEVNKKNNLIFYGIAGEHRETPSDLLLKVRIMTRFFFKKN